MDFKYQTDNHTIIFVTRHMVDFLAVPVGELDIDGRFLAQVIEIVRALQDFGSTRKPDVVV